MSTIRHTLFLINHHDVRPPCFDYIVTLYIYVPEKFAFVILELCFFMLFTILVVQL